MKRTLEKVASMSGGVTRERIRQIESKIFKILKKKGFKKNQEEMLDLIETVKTLKEAVVEEKEDYFY